MKLCVGLFGTCAGSRWRDPFKARYEREGIEWFDPQVDNWTPELAVVEAEHLAEDAVILFPVTAESYGSGSLAEVGFSILNAIRLDDQREFVVLIEQRLDERLMENETAAKESLRSRALVSQHLKKLRLSNLYVVDTLEEMLEVSVLLYRAAALRVPLQRLNPHNRRGG